MTIKFWRVCTLLSRIKDSCWEYGGVSRTNSVGNSWRSRKRECHHWKLSATSGYLACQSKQITPNLWQNVTTGTYYWLFHPHIPISIPIETSAREVIYCTNMFSDKLLLAFGFNTSKYQQIGENQDQPLKSYHLRRGWIIGMWYFAPHEMEGAHVFNSDSHFFFSWYHGTDLVQICQDQRLREILEKMSWN